MKPKIYLLLIFAICFACQKDSILPNIEVQGEWKLMASYPLTFTYKRKDFPAFDFEKAIYTLNFDSSDTAKGKINLLVFESSFKLSKTSQVKNKISGTFEFYEFKILNKPFETEEDTQIKQALEKVAAFALTINKSEKFDYLSLYSDQTELFFVRKN